MMTFHVVVNDIGQYSVWPSDREPPSGWCRAEVTGSRVECLAWIDANWRDVTRVGVGSALVEGGSRAQ